MRHGQKTSLHTCHSWCPVGFDQCMCSFNSRERWTCVLGPLAGTVLAHNTCHGYYVFLNATGTASTRTSLNTSSEVTRHECFLYLYHVLKKSPATTVSYICLLTHWLLQLFHCLTCHTPFTFCSPCLILYDVAIIFMAEKYVHSKVHTHDTADKGLKYITILYGR